jgi:hypothetical protein
MQEILGRVYRELKPYALYPLDEYFHGRTENQTPTSFEEEAPRYRADSLNRMLDLPVKQAA